MLNYKIDYKKIISIASIVLVVSYKFALLKYLSILLFFFGFFLKNKLVIGRKDLLQIPQINILFLLEYEFDWEIIFWIILGKW